VTFDLNISTCKKFAYYIHSREINTIYNNNNVTEKNSSLKGNNSAERDFSIIFEK